MSAVVVDDDPAADLHDWYGRYLYFSPDEMEPLEADEAETTRKGVRHGSLRLGVPTSSSAIIVAAAVVMGLVSLPDARRYLKMRRM